MPNLPNFTKCSGIKIMNQKLSSKLPNVELNGNKLRHLNYDNFGEMSKLGNENFRKNLN